MQPGPGLEWPLSLDVQALMANGWNPLPFGEFVIKVHSRCDLSCDYCYVYEMADQSWRDQPRRMTRDVAERTAMRIAEHVHAHGLRRATLIVHGGEPLLAGRDLISYLVTETRCAAGPGVTVNACVQTNAIGLDNAYLEMFDKLDIQVGVSLDGDAKSHDRHRRFASGRGSYNAVVSGLQRLTQPRFRHLFSGLLCTIDLRNDPLATYDALVAFEPPKIDLLLPHGTWEVPPPGRLPNVDDSPYADWLITVFDHWYPSPRTRIRLFEEIMYLILGGVSAAEMVGLAPVRVVVIETDGAIEQVDTLKAAYHGAAATGLHVTRDPLDAALLLPGVVARQLGARALSSQCQACSIQRVCGGGLYSHRYRSGTGFANPSVYCPDLMRLIGYIHETMDIDISARLRKRAAK